MRTGLPLPAKMVLLVCLPLTAITAVTLAAVLLTSQADLALIQSSAAGNPILLEALTAQAVAARDRMLLLSLLALATSIGVTGWIGYGVTKQMLALRDATVRLASGDLDSPVTRDGADRFVEMAQALESLRLGLRSRFDLEVNRAAQARRLLEQAVLLEISQVAGSSLELDEVLRHITRLTARACLARECSVYLLTEAGDALHPVMVQPASGEIDALTLQSFRDLPWVNVDDFPLLREVLRDGRPALLDRSQQQRHLPPRWAGATACSNLLAVPLLGRGQAIGIMALHGDECEDDPSPLSDQIDLARTIGAQVSGAILNARLFLTIRQNAEEVSLVSDILRGLNAHPDVAQAFSTVAARLQALTGCARVSLALLDESREWVTLVALDGPHGELGQGARMRVGDTAAAGDVLAGRLHLTPDLSTETGFPAERLLYQAGQRSRINLPLATGQEVFGGLNLTWPIPKGYRVPQLPLLGQIADTLALAVEKDRLFAETRAALAREQRLNELARSISAVTDLETILSNVVRLATELAGADAGTLALLEPDGETAVLPYLFNLPEELRGSRARRGQSVAWRVMETGQSILLADYSAHPNALPNWTAAGVRAFIGVPVTAGDARLGALSLFGLTPEKRFTERDQALAEAVGRQAGVVIQNARLFQAAGQRAAELEALRQASLNLTANLELPAVLNAILENSLRLLQGAQDAHVFLYRPEGEAGGGRVTFGAALWSDGRKDTPWSEPREDGLTYRVARGGEPIVVPDARHHPLYLNVPGGWAGAIIGLPLNIAGRVVGVMNVAYEQPHRFEESELRMLHLLADQAAIAIENARLFGEVQRLAVTDEVTGTHNRRHFFALAEREFSRALRFEHPLSAIMLDIDHFKGVNDTHGHAVGDRVLRAVAERCAANIRDVDILGRYGGDEFALLLPETDLEAAQSVAERLWECVASVPVPSPRGALSITVSLGVAQAGPDTPDLSALLDRADLKMYSAKQSGRAG